MANWYSSSNLLPNNTHGRAGTSASKFEKCARFHIKTYSLFSFSSAPLQVCYTYDANRQKIVRNSLYRFYTKPEVTRICWQHFTDTLSALNRSISDLLFVGPSAGTGTFYELFPSPRRLGIDIVPKCDDVIPQDFLKVTVLPVAPRDTAIIGNPPFGKRGKLAIAFFNHAAYLADLVAFIVPVNFRKFTVHKQLNLNMRFIS